MTETHHKPLHPVDLTFTLKEETYILDFRESKTPFFFARINFRDL